MNGNLINNSTITSCDCDKEKCQSCSLEHLTENLCAKCNNGFYQIENDNLNFDEYFNCYKNPIGYYLDITDSLYKNCYFTCETCEIKGDSSIHNCLECNSDYPLKMEKNNYFNCYKNCHYYYYFDSKNNFHCTNNWSCPDEYPNLLPFKKECVNYSLTIYESTEYINANLNDFNSTEKEMHPTIFSNINKSEEIIDENYLSIESDNTENNNEVIDDKEIISTNAMNTYGIEEIINEENPSSILYQSENEINYDKKNIDTTNEYQNNQEVSTNIKINYEINDNIHEDYHSSIVDKTINAVEKNSVTFYNKKTEITEIIKTYKLSEIINEQKENSLSILSQEKSEIINTIIKEQKCVNKNDIENLIKHEKIENNEIIYYDKIQKIIEACFTSEDYDKSKLDNGENEEIKIKRISFTLTTLKNQRDKINENETIINIGECEFSLRKLYNIPDNETLYITKKDTIQEGVKMTKMEYDIYYKTSEINLKKLNLSICKDDKIYLSIPFEINENLDKFNISSRYYNDICYKAQSERGADIT